MIFLVHQFRIYLLIASPRKGEPLTPFLWIPWGKSTFNACQQLAPFRLVPLFYKYRQTRIFQIFQTIAFLCNVPCFCHATWSDCFRLFYVPLVRWLLSTVNPLFTSASDCSFCLFFVFIYFLHPFPISLPCQFRRSRQTLKIYKYFSGTIQKSYTFRDVMHFHAYKRHIPFTPFSTEKE